MEWYHCFCVSGCFYNFYHLSFVQCLSVGVSVHLMKVGHSLEYNYPDYLIEKEKTSNYDLKYSNRT